MKSTEESATRLEPLIKEAKKQESWLTKLAKRRVCLVEEIDSLKGLPESNFSVILLDSKLKGTFRTDVFKLVTESSIYW